MAVRVLLGLAALTFGSIVWAQDALVDASEREPAGGSTPLVAASRRTYPGGGDEEDLQVQGRIPDAALRTDSRSLQREVYKVLYNQELQDERKEDVEE